MPRIWRTVNPDPKDPMDGGRDLQYKTRYGWQTVAMGNSDKIPCGGKGGLFRKHLYKKTGKCRRCGLMKADETNHDKVFTQKG